MPPNVPTSLPHQTEGTDFLRRNERAALFDEQGLGKSKQLIDAIAAQISSGELAGALIVCPNGVKTNWARRSPSSRLFQSRFSRRGERRAAHHSRGSAP